MINIEMVIETGMVTLSLRRINSKKDFTSLIKNRIVESVGGIIRE
ncbi:hypothetical protein [Candidatus Nitrosocosmicus sp. FF01]